MLPRCQWQITHYGQQPHSVDVWKQRSAAPKAQLEVYNIKKEDVTELMDSYFNTCTVVGLRLLYAKCSRLLAEAQPEAAKANVTETLELIPFSAGIIRTHFAVECKFR